jgi:hypothetical protein
MKNLLTNGEKIWVVSVLLYILWVFIGLNNNISTQLIPILGSLGMIVFVVIANIIRILI